MRRKLGRLATMAIMLTFLGDDCSNDVSNKNASYLLWPQDEATLSAWDVTAGSIRKAPTWDEADPGIEFVDAPTEIAQQNPLSAACARVTVSGYVEASAELTVSTTQAHDIPALNWGSYVFYLALPDSADHRGNTLRIRKSKPGTVVLTEIRLAIGDRDGCDPSAYTPADSDRDAGF